MLLSDVLAAIPATLTRDLLRPSYRAKVAAGANPLTGHCYVACEAIYHLCGGKDSGLRPQTIQHEGGPHWFLRDADGSVVDPTAAQFSTPVPYENGRGCGFLTREPSKRAQVVIDRIGGKPAKMPSHGGHRHGTEGGTVTIGIRFPRDYVAALDAECKATGKERSDIMRGRLGL